MLYPFLAVLFDVVTLITTKRLFRRFGVLTYRSFAVWLFIWIIAIGLILFPWFASIQPAAIEPKYLWLLLAVAFLAANYNLLYYFSLEREKITAIEPFLLVSPIVTILIAGLFYASERSWHVYVAAGVAGLVLAWLHLKRHRRLKLNFSIIALVGFAVLYGLEAVVLKQLLVVYSPLAMYLVRAIITAIFLLVLERGRLVRLTPRQIPYFLLIAGAAVAASTAIYSAYREVGISLTIFILLLSPIMVYLLSALWLKEKLTWKNLLASGVIIGLVIWLAIAR
ncbi:MAG: DMT family transporter [Patescibacteria group bacterium]